MNVDGLFILDSLSKSKVYLICTKLIKDINPTGFLH